MRENLKIFFVVAFLLVIHSVSHSHCDSDQLQASQSLDGNSYSVRLTRPSGINTTGWKTDTFVFDSGEMYADYLRKREGFKSAPYNATKSESDQGTVIKFLYEATNKYGSTLKIEGTVIGNSIEGTATWTSDRGPFSYLFTGTLM